MATTKVSALSAKTSLAGSEELLINDSGTSKKVTATNLLAGATVADGSISTAKLAADSVTGAKIADDAIDSEHYTDGSIDTAHIADDAVTEAKLANAINTAIAANTAKVTNATHTGDVTGATALTIAADAVTTAKIADDNVTADKLANSINTDIATGVTANTTANAALPKAGGTMTGDLILGDDVKLEVGDATGGDLQVWHDGANSHIKNTTGTLFINSDGMTKLQDAGANETFAVFNDNGASELYHDNSKKIETTANGVTVTGTAIATTDTDTSNSGTVDLDFAAKQNFVLTLTGNITSLTASNEVAGQSGFIVFIQDGTGSRTVALHGDYETAGGAGLTLTSTASATDIVPYVVAASSRILLGTPQLAFS